MYLELFVVICLTAAVWLDVYSLYVRLSGATQNRSEGLALANWVLYLARILIMSSSFALAYIFESKQTIRFSELILLGFALGTLLVIAFMRYRVVELLICKLIGLVLFMPAKSFAREGYFWRPLSHPKLPRMAAAIATCLFMNTGIFSTFRYD